jgi:DNA-binding MarR family transcriptional regulator
MRQYAALHGIRDGANSPGELARLWQVTPAVITGIIDRLERRGLVRREPDPEDRRRLQLALTAAGQAANDAVERTLTAELAAQLANVSDAQRDELRRSLALLQRIFAAGDEGAAMPAPLNAEDEMPGWHDDESNPRPLDVAETAARHDLVGAVT